MGSAHMGVASVGDVADNRHPGRKNYRLPDWTTQMTLNHECLNGRHCNLGAQPNPTPAPNTLCEHCVNRTRRRITQLPWQYLQLHAMIGDRTPDMTPARHKPESTVLLNTAIDTLLCTIHHHVTLAAEIVADQLHADNPCHHQPAAHVHACCRLINPNLDKLLDLPELDVMEWDHDGTHFHVTTTTGPAICQRLDHLGAIAHYTLGQTRTRSYRDIPCARCGHTTVGRWTGSDTFDCETCGAQFPEHDIRHHDRILLERHRRGLLHA